MSTLLPTPLRSAPIGTRLPSGVPLARTLERLALPHLSRSLVTREAESELQRMSRTLPALVSSDMLFESRLAPASPEVDLALFVTACGRDFLLQDDATPISGTDATGASGAGVRALCRALRTIPRLAAAARGVWLELDMELSRAARPGDRPVPGVYLEFDKSGRPRDPAKLLDLSLIALAALFGREVPRATASTIRRCLEALPDTAHVENLGWFPRRSNDVVRLCVANLPDRALPDLLARVRWPGDPREPRRSFEKLLPRHRDGAAPICGYLHLDVAGDDVLPRVSREYACERRAQLEGRLQESAFLDRLVEVGLCSEDQSAALRAWPGWEITQLDHELWPSLVARRVNHVKIVFDAPQELSAKVYFGMSHRFRPYGRAVVA